MDKKSWLAVVLCVLGLIGWQWYMTKAYPPAPPQEAPATADATATPASTSTPGAATTPDTTSAPVPLPSDTPVISARNESLTTKTAEYIFSNDGGGIERAILLVHEGEQEQAVFLNGNRSLPIGSLSLAPGKPLGGFEMSMDRTAESATFSRTMPDGLQITKRFTLPAEGADNPYLVQMEVEFTNTGTQPVDFANYFVGTGGAAPIHARDLPTYTRFEWFHEGKMDNIDVHWFDAGTIPLVGIQTRPARDLYDEQKPDVSWAAVASQYFTTIVTTETTKGIGAAATRFDTHKQNSTPVYGIQGALGMPGFNLAPGEKHVEKFAIYMGPKDLSLLRKMDGGQDRVMNFGMFGFISETLLWAMNTLNNVFNSYAAAIIVLTLIIKSLLWPVQNKATNEMRKMAALSPKMTEMREKFKDDPQKMNEEMMKLYREYGVNPFSGCLPMLIQIPIFFGFYAMLGSAIQLRNSSFFWVHDLSQPDTVGHILGFPINVLPIIMAFTMVWQMIITPKSGDAMQQRMLYFMPIIFLIFCYNYASGLALYWTTQNLFSIVQLYLTRNKPLPTLEKKSVIAKRAANAAAVKSKKKKKPRPGA